MSKQPKRKYEVMRSMTESQIKNVGGMEWARHRGITVVWVGLAFFVVMLVLQAIIDPQSEVFAWCIVGGFLAMWSYIYTMCIVMGRRLWKQVKDQNEPIDLRGLDD